MSFFLPHFANRGEVEEGRGVGSGGAALPLYSWETKNSLINIVRREERQRLTGSICYRMNLRGGSRFSLSLRICAPLFFFFLCFTPEKKTHMRVIFPKFSSKFRRTQHRETTHSRNGKKIRHMKATSEQQSQVMKPHTHSTLCVPDGRYRVLCLWT